MLSASKGLIEEQICNITDGGCEYTGQTMERSHRGLELTTLHFNALVENMQKAMRDNDIPYHHTKPIARPACAHAWRHSSEVISTQDDL